MLPKLYDRKKVNHESCTIIFRWPLGLKFHNICSMPAGCDFWSLIAVASLKRATAPLQVQPFQSSTQVVPCRKSVHFDPSMKSSIFEKSLLNGPMFPSFAPDRGESCRRLWRLNKIDFPRCHCPWKIFHAVTFCTGKSRRSGFPQALSTIEDVVAHFRRMQETDCPSGDEASPGHLRNWSGPWEYPGNVWV